QGVVAVGRHSRVFRLPLAQQLKDHELAVAPDLDRVPARIEAALSNLLQKRLQRRDEGLILGLVIGHAPRKFESLDALLPAVGPIEDVAAVALPRIPSTATVENEQV